MSGRIIVDVRRKRCITGQSGIGDRVGDEVAKLGVVGAVEEVVALALAESNLELGHLVAEVVLVVVEMLLEKIEQHGDMRGAVDVLKLVAAEFGHNEAVFTKFVENIEEGDAYIAGEDGAGQQVMDEGSGGRLAFSAGDADGEVAIDLQEEVGEGRKLVVGRWQLEIGDAGGLDDKVEGPVGMPLVVRGFPATVNDLGSDGVMSLGQEALYQALGALAFATVASNQYATVEEKGFQLIFSVHAT